MITVVITTPNDKTLASLKGCESNSTSFTRQLITILLKLHSAYLLFYLRIDYDQKPWLDLIG
jgi:hypothetical protein